MSAHHDLEVMVKLVVKRRPLLNCQPNCKARPHRMLLFTSFSNKQGDAWVVSKMRVFIAPNRSLYIHGSMTVAFVLLSLGNAPSSTAWSQYGGSCPPPPKLSSTFDAAADKITTAANRQHPATSPLPERGLVWPIPRLLVVIISRQSCSACRDVPSRTALRRIEIALHGLVFEEEKEEEDSKRVRVRVDSNVSNNITQLYFNFYILILVAFLISLFFHYHAPTLRLYGGLASHHGDRERPQRNGRPSVPPSLARRAIPCEPVYSVRGAPCKFLLFWVDVKYCLLLLDTLVSKNNC